MNKVVSYIKKNWLLYLIILQPVLDILSYFQDKYMGNSYSWIFRILLLCITFLITFINSKEKKKIILSILPFAVYTILHFVNLFRIEHLNLIMDIKYFILVFQMPILTILLISYIKQNKNEFYNINKGMYLSFVIIAISVFIAFITNTYESTYYDVGILGWFSSANTQSMILCALCPWILYISFKSNNKKLYFLISLIVFILLYSNATKSCYLTLVSSFAVMLFCSIISKNRTKKKLNILIPLIFLTLSFVLYKFSFTMVRQSDSSNVNKENLENIKLTLNKNNKVNEFDHIDFSKITTLSDKEIVEILNTSYIYKELIEIHGEKEVVKEMRDNLSASSLSDNRLRKITNAKIEYNNVDFTTKILGIGYSVIGENSLDLENDLTAIFYYYGYLGITIYMIFIGYFICLLARLFLKNYKIIHDAEYVVLVYLILLLIAGGEYSGAFLRKSNANIYLSLFFAIAYFKVKGLKLKNKLNNNKISFLLLHLGYGGIESATINTANALSDKYEIELLSFYNLDKNQENKLNKNINVKYLYNGGPNKEKFLDSIKNRKVVSIFKEGFKALNILIKKKLLIIKYIKNCDSKYIISTRVEFSSLLSKYGKHETIKIAQEHHHHNNNKKYIRKLKNNYDRIDYLCALTTTLKNDYEKFLNYNNHTKIILMPNMLSDFPTKKTDLKNKNFISVSRLDEGKRIDEIIKIFSKINNKDSELYIIGDGKEFTKLQQLIEDLKLSDKVHMLGYLDKKEIEKYMLKSSIFLMTSISEGLPMVLLETMSYGLPCVAYETDSGTSDIIDNGKNGYIIKNRNEEEYIEKINILIGDQEKLKEFSNNSIIKSKEFSSEEILKAWNKILK